MKKLVAVSMFAVLALAGCPKKKEEAKPADPAPKVVEPPKTEEPPKVEPTPPTTEVKPVTMPAECTDYKEAIAKASACEKLETKADLKKKFDESWAAWEKLDDAGRTAAAAECKTAAASVKEATTKACP